MYIIIGIIALVAVLFFLSTYTVVEPNQAHIVTRLSKGRKVFTPKLGSDGKPMGKTAYFYIPFLMKRDILYLTNVKEIISNIELHDKEVAPFLCDVVCWFHISNPSLAAERLDLASPFESVKDSLVNLIQAVGREAAMKQEVLDIMRDRKTFRNSVKEAVASGMEHWGVDIVDLEINDIRDSDNSHVISNYESIRQVQVQTTARKVIAERTREAVEVEQENKRIAEIKMAETEEAFRKRQIEKDRAIGVSEAEKEKLVAETTQQANSSKVAAQRTLDVGLATVTKESTIERATGDAEAVRIKGEKAAAVVKLTGSAEADVIRLKGLSEAEAKAKMAEALKLFNDAGITLEQIKAFVAVQVAKFENLAKAFNGANINLASSDPNKIFGFGLDAEGGTSFGQFLSQIQQMTGKTLPEIVTSVKETVTKKKE